MAARPVIRIAHGLPALALLVATAGTQAQTDGLFLGSFEPGASDPVPGALAFQNVASERLDQVLNSDYRFDALFVDFNNDGCIDPFIYAHTAGGASSRLWLNRCDGSHTFVYAANAQVNHHIASPSNPQGSGWLTRLDFNGDGRQDYWTRDGNNTAARYVNGSATGSFMPWFSGKEAACDNYCAFADITGSGALEIVHRNRKVAQMSTHAQILPASGTAGYQVVGDITGDGWPEIIQPSNRGYWRNDAGSLTWVSAPVLRGGYSGQMLLADFDNDGDNDLFTLDVRSCNDETSPITRRAWLLRNDGSGGFSDATPSSGALASISTLDCITNYGNIAAGDFDNDGRQDLMVAGLSVSSSVKLYRNTGSLSFSAANVNFGASEGQAPGGGWEPSSPRADLGDFDLDGRLDIVKTQHLSNIGLWRNTTGTNGGRWMRVRVRGEGSNSDGIGAQVRWYRPGTSQLVTSMPVLTSEQHAQTHLHAGLGGQHTVDLEVRFGNGGPVRRFAGVASNQEVIVYANGCLLQNWQPGDGWPLSAPAGCGN